MKKIFAALAVMTMAVACAGYAQAHNGHAPHDQLSIEYRFDNGRCYYGYHGYGYPGHGHGRGHGCSRWYEHNKLPQ